VPTFGHTGFNVDRHYRATSMKYVNINSAHLQVKSELWASAVGTVLLISSSTSNYSPNLHVINVNFCSYLEYDIQCDIKGFNVETYIRKKPYKGVVSNLAVGSLLHIQSIFKL